MIVRGSGSTRGPAGHEEPRVVYSGGEVKVIFKSLVVGPLEANCFVLACDKSREGIVVDPGEDAPAIVEVIRETGTDVVAVVATHGHFDHIGRAGSIVSETGAPFAIHRADLPMVARLVEIAGAFGLEADPLRRSTVSWRRETASASGRRPFRSCTRRVTLRECLARLAWTRNRGGYPVCRVDREDRPGGGRRGCPADLDSGETSIFGG